MRDFIFAFMTLFLSASTDTKAVFAMMKSTNNFRALRSDPRAKYEPGAETNIRIIAANLNRAIREDEQKHYLETIT
ncbi:MAG: hypothetical protein P8Z75_15455 [Gammaproteobacteria bacterium]|jgi:hypothetical protein